MRKNVLELAIIISMISPTALYAQVYKCVDSKNRISYQSGPCNVNSKEQLTDIEHNVGVHESASPNIKQLDALVRSALATGNLTKAKELAVTQQHWQWIEERNYRSEQVIAGRTEADLSSEKYNSQECESAKRSYMIETSRLKPTNASIAAKEAIMRQACGLREPTRHIENNEYNNNVRIYNNR